MPSLEEKIHLAREYAELGLRVFPLAPGQKKPLHKGWQREATNDAGRIADLIKAAPSCNLGIRTGDGLVAIDIDPAKGGNDTFAALVAEHGEFPRTATSYTGGGGRHYVFLAEATYRNRENVLPGLDVRGQGGLITVAPSIHPVTGKIYGWELHPRDGFAPLSGWLGELIATPANPRRCEQRGMAGERPRVRQDAVTAAATADRAAVTVEALARLVDDLAGRFPVTGPGQRNDQMSRVIASLAGRGYSDHVILQVLDAWHARFGGIVTTGADAARREAESCLRSKRRSPTFGPAMSTVDHQAECDAIRLRPDQLELIVTGILVRSGDHPPVTLIALPPSPCPPNAMRVTPSGVCLCSSDNDIAFVEALVIHAMHKVQLGEFEPADPASLIVATHDQIRAIAKERHGLEWFNPQFERLKRRYISRPGDGKPAKRFELLVEKVKGHKRPGGPAGVPSEYLATGIRRLLAKA